METIYARDVQGTLLRYDLAPGQAVPEQVQIITEAAYNNGLRLLQAERDEREAVFQQEMKVQQVHREAARTRVATALGGLGIDPDDIAALIGG